MKKNGENGKNGKKWKNEKMKIWKNNNDFYVLILSFSFPFEIFITV